MDIIGDVKKSLLERKANGAFEKENYEEASRHFKALYELVKDTENPNVALYVQRIGDCYEKKDHVGADERIKDHKEAGKYYIRAADLFRRKRDYEKAGEVYENGAKTFEEVDMFEEAAKFYLESSSMFMESKDFVNASYAFHTAADLLLKAHKYVDAADTFRKAAVCDLKIHDNTNGGISYKRAAICYQKMSQFKEAIDSYAASVELDTLTRNYLEVASTYDKMANCYYELNDKQNTIYHHIKSAEMRAQNGDLRNAAISYQEIGQVYEHDNDLDNAILFYLKAAKTFFHANCNLEEAGAFARTGKVYSLRDDFDNAGDMYLESARANFAGKNDKMGVESSLYAAEMFLKASGATKDPYQAGLFTEKAAKAYADIREFIKAAKTYSTYAEFMDKADKSDLANKGFDTSAQMYINAGKIWEGAEAYLNKEDYAKAYPHYEKYADRAEDKKDWFTAGVAHMEAANCHRRLAVESLWRMRISKAITSFNKFLEEHREKPKTVEEMVVIGDCYRKIGELERQTNEFNLCITHLNKAKEQYQNANDQKRLKVVDATISLVEGIKSIDHGYYPKAEEMLGISAKAFDEIVNSKAWKREYTRILADQANEAREHIDKIKLKPEVVLDIDRRSYTFANIPVIVNVKITNDGKYTMKDITFLEHLPDEVKLTKLPDTIPQIEPGKVEKTSIELTPQITGYFRLKPLEVYYEDQKDHRYVKASTEIIIEVVEQPASDYKNFMTAIEIYQKYATSQEENENWFQAGDGYRKISWVYGKFQGGQTLTDYFKKAAENYGKYLKEWEGREVSNKTEAKRLADAFWYHAESLRSLNDFEPAAVSYERSVPLYRNAGLDSIAYRSLAFRLKVIGTKSIQVGDYDEADKTLKESLEYFDNVMKGGKLEEDDLVFVEKNEDEVKSMISTIKHKPRIKVDITYPVTSLPGQVLDFLATVSNPMSFKITNIKPVVKAQSFFQIIEKPPNIPQIDPNMQSQVKFRLKIMEEGKYKFKPLDLTYVDAEGNSYMKGTNEVEIEVSGTPVPQTNKKKDIDMKSSADIFGAVQMVGESGPRNEVVLEVDRRSYTFVNIPVFLNAKLENQCDYEVRNITFMEHLPDMVNLTKLPENIEKLKVGGTSEATLELLPSQTGMFRIQPIELYYEDPGGARYVKASNELVLEVVERPASDFKNYMSAVEVYRKYAISQVENKSWFQAGDGYRQISEVYGKFKTDEKLGEFFQESAKYYRLYVEEHKDLKFRDETDEKRYADALWYLGENLRALDRLDEATEAYTRSVTHYRNSKMVTLALRSNAMSLKTEGTKSIKLGNYRQANQVLKDARDKFNETVMNGGLDDSQLKYIEKMEDEVKSMLDNVKDKPEIDVKVTCQPNAQVGVVLEMSVLIGNPMDSSLSNIRPTIKVNPAFEIAQTPMQIPQIAPGTSQRVIFKIKPLQEGHLKFQPLDVTYSGKGGNSFMKGSNEVEVDVAPAPAIPQKQSPPQAQTQQQPTPPTQQTAPQQQTKPPQQYQQTPQQQSQQQQAPPQAQTQQQSIPPKQTQQPVQQQQTKPTQQSQQTPQQQNLQQRLQSQAQTQQQLIPPKPNQQTAPQQAVQQQQSQQQPTPPQTNQQPVQQQQTKPQQQSQQQQAPQQAPTQQQSIPPQQTQQTVQQQQTKPPQQYQQTPQQPTQQQNLQQRLQSQVPTQQQPTPPQINQQPVQQQQYQQPHTRHQQQNQQQQYQQPQKMQQIQPQQMQQQPDQQPIQQNQPQMQAAPQQPVSAPSAPQSSGEPVSVILSFSRIEDVAIGQPTILSGTLTNNGSEDVMGLRFIGKNKSEIDILETPPQIDRLTAGQSLQVNVKIIVNNPGSYNLAVIEMFYKNLQGKRFFRSSEQTSITTQGMQPTQ